MISAVTSRTRSSRTDIWSLSTVLRRFLLENSLTKSKSGIVVSAMPDVDGKAPFETACKMGLEAIASKRKDKPYMSGPCKCWVKVKNPQATAMLRFTD
jgi:bifunctional non-homologous end joining protein LigD